MPLQTGTRIVSAYAEDHGCNIEVIKQSTKLFTFTTEAQRKEFFVCRETLLNSFTFNRAGTDRQKVSCFIRHIGWPKAQGLWRIGISSPSQRLSEPVADSP
jgi:hypothetical protein